MSLGNFSQRLLIFVLVSFLSAIHARASDKAEEELDTATLPCIQLCPTELQNLLMEKPQEIALKNDYQDQLVDYLLYRVLPLQSTQRPRLLLAIPNFHQKAVENIKYAYLYVREFFNEYTPSILDFVLKNLEESNDGLAQTVSAWHFAFKSIKDFQYKQRAHDYLKEAIELGNPQAHYFLHLAYQFEHFLGLKPNAAEAFDHLLFSAAAEYDPAIVAMARISLYGYQSYLEENDLFELEFDGLDKEQIQPNLYYAFSWYLITRFNKSFLSDGLKEHLTNNLLPHMGLAMPSKIEGVGVAENLSETVKADLLEAHDFLSKNASDMESLEGSQNVIMPALRYVKDWQGVFAAFDDSGFLITCLVPSEKFLSDYEQVIDNHDFLNTFMLDNVFQRYPYKNINFYAVGVNNVKQADMLFELLGDKNQGVEILKLAQSKLSWDQLEQETLKRLLSYEDRDLLFKQQLLPKILMFTE